MIWNGEWSLINEMKLVLGLQTVLRNFPDALDGRLNFQVLWSFMFCEILRIFEKIFLQLKVNCFQRCWEWTYNSAFLSSAVHWLSFICNVLLYTFLVIVSVQISMVLIQGKRIQYFFLRGSVICGVLKYVHPVLFFTTWHAFTIVYYTVWHSYFA